MDDVDVRADVECLPLRDRTVPFVVCSDVLEHVVSDSQALREIRRVLRPDGLALVHVPIVATETVEYDRAIEVDYGHRRAYGPDLVERVRDAGFELRLFRSVDVPRRDRRRWGLHPDSILLLTPRTIGSR